TLKHAENKLHPTFTNDDIHYHFLNRQYIPLTIYHQNPNHKNHLTPQPQHTSNNFPPQLNPTPFHYPHLFKLYHPE
ncbi:putative mucin/carbohydrate-binding domain-containing protein, partial [Bacillus thuringiensis]|uniref:putative mucin/carbohydrate-binding domain-containing protein n=1 Tax=Bacillus thuringiensis TaxID=1428 RepID=UPI0011A80D47